MHNTSMMFAVLVTLLSEGKVTKKYLAEKLEVSERSIIRYMDALTDAGVPVYSTRGCTGGYSISAEFQFDKSYFTEGELNRMITLLKKSDDGERKKDAAIIGKLKYMNKRKHDERYLLETDNLIIDAGPWSNPALYRSKMEIIQKAIDKQKSLNMMYVDRYEAKTHRLFDPYYRILKAGVWYVFGYCHYRCDFRLFKLARIKSLIETDEAFSRRECDVYEKLEGEFDDAEIIDLEIEFSSTVLNDIEEWLGFEAVLERGYKYIAKAKLASGQPLISKLLSFGSSVKVLSPPFLREEVLIECKRILRNAGAE